MTVSCFVAHQPTKPSCAAPVELPIVVNSPAPAVQNDLLPGVVRRHVQSARGLRHQNCNRLGLRARKKKAELKPETPSLPRHPAPPPSLGPAAAGGGSPRSLLLAAAGSANPGPGSVMVAVVMRRRMTEDSGYRSAMETLRRQGNVRERVMTFTAPSPYSSDIQNES